MMGQSRGGMADGRRIYWEAESGRRPSRSRRKDVFVLRNRHSNGRFLGPSPGLPSREVIWESRLDKSQVRFEFGERTLVWESALSRSAVGPLVNSQDWKWRVLVLASSPKGELVLGE